VEAAEMALYLVSYDLDQPGPKDYSKLEGRLRNMGAVRVLYSQWVLSSSLLPNQLEEDFMKYIDPSADSFLLVAIGRGQCAWNRLRISDDEFRKLLV
jgi:hypothetical protein